MSGFVSLYRGFHLNKVFNKGPFCEPMAWVWLLLNAAWRDCQVRISGRVVTLKRGQLSFSSRFMAEAFGWSEAKIRRYLSKLKTDAMIDVTTDAGQYVITICNYDRYQIMPSSGDAPDDAAPDAPTTQQRRSSDAKKNKDNTLEESKGGAAPEFSYVGKVVRLKADQFDRWKQAYPYLPDYVAALTKADDYYSQHPEKTENGKKWFFPVSRWLESENAKHAPKRKSVPARLVVGTPENEAYCRSMGIEPYREAK